jgi:hypothetical protein
VTSEPPKRLIAVMRMQQHLLRQYFLEEHFILSPALGSLTYSFSTFVCASKHGVPIYIVDIFIVFIVFVAIPPSGNPVKSLVVFILVVDETYSTMKKRR